MFTPGNITEVAQPEVVMVRIKCMIELRVQILPLPGVLDFECEKRQKSIRIPYSYLIPNSTEQTLLLDPSFSIYFHSPWQKSQVLLQCTLHYSVQITSYSPLQLHAVERENTLWAVKLTRCVSCHYR